VSRPRIEIAPRTPWSLRLFDRIPLPAFWAGVAIAIAVFGVFLLYSALLGDAPGQLAAIAFAWPWVAEGIQAGVLGFAIAVVGASVRGARNEIEALRPVLAQPLRDAADLHQHVLRYPRVPLVGLGLCGVLSAIPTVLSAEMWIDGHHPGWTHPSVLWLLARNALTWWIVLRGMALDLAIGWRFSRIAEHVVFSDSFDRAVFEPFARRALRNVLLWMLFAVWVSLTYVGPGWAIGPLMVLGLTTITSFALAAFLLPLLGPHARLRAAKQAELARVRAAIRAARDRVLARDAGEVGGGRLGDLVAYEARVEAASEWPIETSTLLRFAFYLALGLGSWVGAGLVQHALETALR
jgi:hypothetical protein